MSHGLHIKAWLIFMFLGALIVPMFIDPSMAQNRVMAETRMMQSIFGSTAADTLIERSNNIFNLMFVQTGVIESLKRREATEQEKSNTERFFNKAGSAGLNATNIYLESTIANMYGLIMRMVLLVAWTPLLLPVAIGVIGDGYTSRFIKMKSFGYYSPAVYSAALHMVIFTVMLPVAYLVVPIVMTPLWLPTLSLLLFASIWLAIQHAQRMLR